MTNPTSHSYLSDWGQSIARTRADFIATVRLEYQANRLARHEACMLLDMIGIRRGVAQAAVLA